MNNLLWYIIISISDNYKAGRLVKIKDFEIFANLFCRTGRSHARGLAFKRFQFFVWQQSLWFTYLQASKIFFFSKLGLSIALSINLQVYLSTFQLYSIFYLKKSHVTPDLWYGTILGFGALLGAPLIFGIISLILAKLQYLSITFV